ncbi:DUF1871 family protein [Pseudoneobacillus sp. C159]
MHIGLVIALNEWDPFGLGFGNYETEIADIVQIVHTTDNETLLAKKIQEVYEFSFEQLIPIDNCQKIARELLRIKSAGSCTL